MARLVADTYDRIRHLIPELAKFGIVGIIGSVIDLGGTAVLHGVFHFGPLTAKAVAVSAATLSTYLGSRFWTFRHRDNHPLPREAALFILLNAVGLLIAELVIAATTYGLSIRDQLAYNVASVIGTGLGTIFRYITYKKWVFVAPRVPATTLVPPDQDLAKP
jgi:putative flippase GtrA